ncbi:MAG: HAMP domain-containing histidine kinase [Candidatus Pacebacteria bacterium]|nr:HAMP domain-containing histidine kinase [Candidatus Paceibacterota bacterium]
MPIELLIHNFGYICSGLISVILAFFILMKGVHKRSYQLIFLTGLSYFAYCIVYLLAVNIQDSHSSSIFAFLMMVAATTPCFNAHLAFSTFNIVKEHTKGLVVMYSALILMYVSYALDSYNFRLVSAPKGYFPNFFVPGPYYWMYMVFFFVVIIYFFSILIKHYKRVDANEQNRLKYFFAGFGWGYLWSLPIYMVILNVPYGVNLMVLTPLMGLYTLPLAYGVYKYDLLNINVAIKSTFLYSFFLVFIGGSIIAVNLLNNYFSVLYTDFPIWILPLISALLVLFVGITIWNQLRQADLLKYEFINNISHKFRTPLTHIRWLAEEFRDMDNREDRIKAVDQIQFASMRLFELTSAVIGASKNTNDLALYRFGEVSVKDLIQDIDKAHKDEVEQKNLVVHFEIDPAIDVIHADKARLQFALQIIFENSLKYTPQGGSITVSVTKKDGEIHISFKDSGIGIKMDDVPHVFSKFFRAVNARHIDTEGMGIGLFIAKDIIEKHKGRIWAESEGESKGSTFNIVLPVN